MNTAAASTRPRSPRLAERGTSLIEVMIALVLLAIGLLGMLGLKAAALKYAGQSNMRAEAAYHATEILDRMRANPVKAAAGAYALALADPTPAAPVGVVQTDLAQWRNGIAADMAAGTGSVTVDPDGTAHVLVQWTERTDQSAAPVVMSFSFLSRL